MIVSVDFVYAPKNTRFSMTVQKDHLIFVLNTEFMFIIKATNECFYVYFIYCHFGSAHAHIQTHTETYTHKCIKAQV